MTITETFLLLCKIEPEGLPSDSALGRPQRREPCLELAERFRVDRCQMGRDEQEGVRSLGFERCRAEVLPVDEDQRVRLSLERQSPQKPSEESGTGLIADDVPGVVVVVRTEGRLGARTKSD